MAVMVRAGACAYEVMTGSFEVSLLLMMLSCFLVLRMVRRALSGPG